MARHNLPILKTYTAASIHEKATIPIRGRSPECKPIGDRKDTHFTIRREADESIVAQCYRSDLIRWYPDGRIFITNGGYASQTTHDFISRLMGRWGYVQCFGHDDKTWIRSDNYDVYPLAKGGQYFTWDSQDNPHHLIAEVPNYPVTHIINKPAMREARKEIAPFVKYFNNIMKLTQWAPMEGSPLYLGSRTVMHGRMMSDDIEVWAPTLQWLVQRGTVNGYEYTKDPQTGNLKYGYRRYVSKAYIKAEITRILLTTHRSKLLTKRTHTKGGLVKDAYKDYADD
jgi:hypothetical protein